MKDQKQHWNELHKNGQVNRNSDKPTTSAIELLGIIPASSKILELGCGMGRDSAALAKAGYTVLATDFSDAAVANTIESFGSIPGLTFQTLDIGKPFTHLQGNEFDVVYARLCLHYFTDEVTRGAMREIHRVLKPDGYLYFICKSTADPLFGEGEEIEKDMFVRDGHVRHFFSEDYVRSILENQFSIVRIETSKEVFYERESAFIKVIVRAEK